MAGITSHTWTSDCLVSSLTKSPKTDRPLLATMHVYELLIATLILLSPGAVFTSPLSRDHSTEAPVSSQAPSWQLLPTHPVPDHRFYQRSGRASDLEDLDSGPPSRLIARSGPKNGAIRESAHSANGISDLLGPVPDGPASFPVPSQNIPPASARRGFDRDRARASTFASTVLRQPALAAIYRFHVTLTLRAARDAAHALDATATQPLRARLHALHALRENATSARARKLRAAFARAKARGAPLRGKIEAALRVLEREAAVLNRLSAARATTGGGAGYGALESEVRREVLRLRAELQAFDGLVGFTPVREG